MKHSSMPYFSITIPTYNRAHMLGRAIGSCLRQDFTSYEIIVVDDGSTDNTMDRLKEYVVDERVVVLRHEQNRGVCPARNTGIARSKGEWLVMVDSDYEVMPGALVALAERTAASPADVGNVASSCLWDTGIVTPLPTVPGQPLCFEEYLAWLDTTVIAEYFNCFRRQVFETVLYPAGRAYELSFHLNVARRWRIDISREPAIIYHTDANDRITDSPPDLAIRRLLMDARDGMADAETMLQEHGSALRSWAPGLYRSRVGATAVYCFLAGQRSKGIRYCVQALRNRSAGFRILPILAIGLISPRALAWTKTRFRRRAEDIASSYHP